MSIVKKLKLSSTPNSSKLAELLLQLRDEQLPVIAPNSMLEDNDIENEDVSNMVALSSSVIADVVESSSDNQMAESEAHTLPASEACNCRKSRCLKLYCQCFANRAICGAYCRCAQCDNKSVTAPARIAAVKSVLDRNPNAFESKYKATNSAAESDPAATSVIAPIVHKNGCRCRKSLCLKKYCECFQGGVHCSGICTCLVCYNRSGAPLLATRVNSLSSSDGVLEQIAAMNAASADVLGSAQLLLKRSFSDSPSDDKLVNQGRYSLSSELNESPSSSSGCESDSNMQSDLPPLPNSNKRRKIAPTSSPLSADFRTTPSSSAAALLALNPQIVNSHSLMSPITPSSFVHVPLLADSTPINIRTASPNSLSVAKALSLLGGNCTLQQALDFATALDNASASGTLTIDLKDIVQTPQLHKTQDMTSNIDSNHKKPHSNSMCTDDEAHTEYGASSANSKSSLSSESIGQRDFLNTSQELTDAESDCVAKSVPKKLVYDEIVTGMVQIV